MWEWAGWVIIVVTIIAIWNTNSKINDLETKTDQIQNSMSDTEDLINHGGVASNYGDTVFSKIDDLQSSMSNIKLSCISSSDGSDIECSTNPD